MPQASKQEPAGASWILPAQRAAVYEQLGRQLKSGLPLSTSLGNLGKGRVPAPIARAVADARVLVEQGAALSVALERHPQAFSAHDVAFLAAAEQAGALPLACLQLAEEHRDRHKRATSLAVQLLYPVGLLNAAIFLMPLTVAFRDGLPAYFATVIPAALSFALVAAGLAWLMAMPQAAAARGALSRGARRLPWMGNKLRQLALARTVRLLAACVGAGLPAAACFRAAERATADPVLGQACAQVARRLDRGDVTVAGALAARADVFPGELCQLVAIGEEAGTLDDTLARAAIDWEEQGRLALGVLFGAARWGMVASAFVFVGWRIVGEMYVHVAQINVLLNEAP